MLRYTLVVLTVMTSIPTNTILVNKTNLLYQYILLCGPEFYDDFENVGSFPVVPVRYQICTKCSRNPKCYSAGNCCPDVYLSYLYFPQKQCTDVAIYLSDNQTSVDEYEIISTCPADASDEVREKCVKLYDISQKIKLSPVTSRKTGLSFKNQFCASCNNASDTIPWRLMVSSSCGKQLQSSTVDDILRRSMHEKCGSIEFSPRGVAPAKSCSKRQMTKGVVDACNITGTWTIFDEDINFACNHFENTFKFYKNVFCYICNPPDVVHESTFIANCNITGIWTQYNETIEYACLRGDTTMATYPFKNIYCYVCNSELDVPKTNTFFVNAITKNSILYYIFNATQGYENYLMSSETKDCQNTSEHHAEYHKWAYKYTCQSYLPISLFDTQSASTIHFQAQKRGCTVSTKKTEINLHLLYAGKPNASIYYDNSLSVDWAFVSNRKVIHLIENNYLTVCRSCFDKSFCRFHADYYNTNCQMYESYFQNKRFPLEHLICRCCFVRHEWDLTFFFMSTGNRGRGNAFFIDAYRTFSQRCHGAEIYDKNKQKCRKTGCLNRWKIVNNVCEPPYKTPDIGYTLPVRFEIQAVSSRDTKRLVAKIQHILHYTYNISTKLCYEIIRGDNNNTSFILQVEILKSSNNINLEKNLMTFLLNVKEDPGELGNVEIIYDSITKNFVNSTFSGTDCLPGRRPLLTNILICRMVSFDKDEYVEVGHTVTINGSRNMFNFYQYYIDPHNKLWLCMEDFEDLRTKESDSNVNVIIQIICNAISSMFLVLTLMTYCLFPTLRTIPGKNIMNLSISLIFHYMTFTFILITDDSGAKCKILGVFSHYFLLTAIGCLFVCAWHMFKLFGTASIASSLTTSRNQQITCWYLSFVYGYALVIVIGNIVVSLVLTSGNSIGYGEGICFISFKESIIITVVVPLTLLSGGDIVLFSITIYRLKQRPTIDCNNAMNQKDSWIFLKLFTTTGCSWTLLLVNAFLNNPFISITISGINSLQGLCIFIAYVLNKRVYNLYASKCRYRKRKLKINRPMSTSLSSVSRTRTSVVEQKTLFIQKRK